MAAKKTNPWIACIKTAIKSQKKGKKSIKDAISVCKKQFKK